MPKCSQIASVSGRDFAQRLLFSLLFWSINIDQRYFLNSLFSWLCTALRAMSDSTTVVAFEVGTDRGSMTLASAVATESKGSASQLLLGRDRALTHAR